jgi:hypothetical protein
MDVAQDYAVAKATTGTFVVTLASDAVGFTTFGLSRDIDSSLLMVDAVEDDDGQGFTAVGGDTWFLSVLQLTDAAALGTLSGEIEEAWLLVRRSDGRLFLVAFAQDAPAEHPVVSCAMESDAGGPGTTGGPHWSSLDLVAPGVICHRWGYEGELHGLSLDASGRSIGAADVTDAVDAISHMRGQAGPEATPKRLLSGQVHGLFPMSVEDFPLELLESPNAPWDEGSGSYPDADFTTDDSGTYRFELNLSRDLLEELRRDATIRWGLDALTPGSAAGRDLIMRAEEVALEYGWEPDEQYLQHIRVACH